MHKYEKTKPIMYICQIILNVIFAKVAVMKTFSSVFEILIFSFYGKFLEKC
jgi:hypothetical protein